MQVPIIKAPQVQQQVQPGVNFTAPQMADPGAQLRQSGQAMMQAGGVAANIANDMQQQVNQTRVDDAMNNYIRASDEIRTEMMSLRGKNAFEPIDGISPKEYYDKKLKSVSDEIVGQLGNDAQKQAFLQSAQRNNAQLYGAFNNHMVAQQKTYENEVNDATISTAVDRAALLYSDSSVLAESDAAISVAVQNKAKANGWRLDDAVTVLEMQKAKSQMHAGVIKGWLDSGNAEKAEEYYKANSASMTVQARANLQQSVYQSAAMSRATSAVQDAIAPLGNDWTVQQVDRELAKKYAGKPDELKMARQELHYQDGIRKAAVADLDSRLLGPVQNAVASAMDEGKFISKAERSVLINTKGLVETPEKRLRAMELIDKHNDELRREQQEATDRARSQAKQTGAADTNAALIKLDMISNPEKWKNANLQAALSEPLAEGKIKPAQLQGLIDTQAKLKKPDAEMQTLQTANQYMDSRLAGSLFGGKKYASLSKTDQAEIKGKLVTVIEPMLAQYQAGGNKATDQEVRKIIDTVFVDKKYKKTFLGIKHGEAFTETEVDIEGTASRTADLVYDKIPAITRSQIENAMRRNRVPINKAAVVEYYQTIKGK